MEHQSASYCEEEEEEEGEEEEEEVVVRALDVLVQASILGIDSINIGSINSVTFD